MLENNVIETMRWVVCHSIFMQWLDKGSEKVKIILTYEWHMWENILPKWLNIHSLKVCKPSLNQHSTIVDVLLPGLKKGKKFKQNYIAQDKYWIVLTFINLKDYKCATSTSRIYAIYETCCLIKNI